MLTDTLKEDTVKENAAIDEFDFPLFYDDKSWGFVFLSGLFVMGTYVILTWNLAPGYLFLPTTLYGNKGDSSISAATSEIC